MLEAALPPSWRLSTLGELSLRGGEYGSLSAAISYSSDLPRYVRITDIGSDGALSRENPASISWDAGRLYLLSNGDLCFARSGATVGKTYLYDSRDGVCAFAGYVIRFSIDTNRAIPEYVSHWTRSTYYWRWVSKTIRQGAQPNINAQEYARQQLPLPPLDEQRRIVAILDSLDDSIRLTERNIAKLERANEGILQHTYDTEYNSVDWTSLALGDLLEERPKGGYSPQAGSHFSGVYMLGLGCLTPQGFYPTQLKFAPDGDPFLSQAMLTEGDLLITRANTRELVGLAGRYSDIGFPCIYPDLMMRLRVNKRAVSDFLELLLRAPSYRRQIQAAASGTSESMVKINSDAVMRLAVSIPSVAEQMEIARRHRNLRERVVRAKRELAKLRDIKQGLMDDLLLGRVRVDVAA